MAREKLTEPEDWKFQPLEDLDQLLRCPICFEYYEATMMFPQCSHNFCSLCIRRYISGGNTKCPMCAASVTERDLKNNRLLDQLIQHFKSSREAFLSLVQNRSSTEDTVEKKERGKEKVEVPGASLERRSPANTPRGRRGKRRLYSVPEAPDLPDTEAFIDDITSNSPAGCKNSGMGQEEGKEGGRESEDSSGTDDVAQSPSFLSQWQPEDVKERERPQLFGELTSEEFSKKRGKGKLRHFSLSSTPSRFHCGVGPSSSSPLPLPSPLPSISPSLNHTSSVCSSAAENSPCSDKVACPVCGQLVLARFINRHLDTICLRQSDTSNSQPQRKYAKIPRLVYQIMKDRQLKVKLKEYNLPTHGDRHVLIGRLKEFILRFNSQCDALNPRSVTEVALEVEEEERMRQASCRQTQQSPVTERKQEMTAEEIEKAKKAYEKRHGDQFSKLVVQARDQMRAGRNCGEKTEERLVGEVSWEKEERGKVGERGRIEGSARNLTDGCDTADEDEVVLAEASPDRDLTPTLVTTMSGGSDRSRSVPESPPHSCGEPFLVRGKRSRQTTPSSTFSVASWSESDEDDEFIPNDAHYRTPSVPSSRTSRKRRRR